MKWFNDDLMNKLFPCNYKEHPFPDYCHDIFEVLSDLMPNEISARIPGWKGFEENSEILDRYSSISETHTINPEIVLSSIARDFLAGAINWRSPELQYNIGSAVIVPSAVIYALSLEVNVYLINDGLAGNCVIAEKAVSNILARLCDLNPNKAHGVFTFGGTATNLYPVKIGTRKVAPDSGYTGLSTKMKIAITEDAHFSHPAAADWTGIGTNNVVTIEAGMERQSSLVDAENKLRSILDEGYAIPTIIINGGTTYDHTVDDIAGFARLRDQLVMEYDLNYKPHLHVDSVIGWVWLFFQGYDFLRNPLEIESSALKMIEKQYGRIKNLTQADSWGVDFHKGIGSCPVDCSFFIVTDVIDLLRLKGSSANNMHQLAQDFSCHSPVDYTIETSRAGGKALAALTALHVLGKRGYQMLLARLISLTLQFRSQILAQDAMSVLNTYALGYQTMVRLYPPELIADIRRSQEMTTDDPIVAKYIRQVNAYLKEFFSWDNKTRMDLNKGGVVYSFSKKFITTPSKENISGLKFYPTSPCLTPTNISSAVNTLTERKTYFDHNIWNKISAKK